MPGFNPENINIHDLTIEEPEEKQEAFFDPEKEITSEDWEGIWELFENMKKEGNWQDAFRMGVNMKIVDPEVDLRIPAQGWGYMSGLFTNDVAGGKSYEAAIKGAEMKIINPHGELGLDEFIYKQMERELENMGKGGWQFGFWTRFFDMAKRMKILFPQNDFDVSKYVVGERKATLEKELKERKERDEEYVFKALATMKIVGYHPDFDGKDLPYWKKSLDGNRTARITQGGKPERIGAWDDFINTSAALKILAAEKVAVTDDGLEITMPKPKLLEIETPPMPETKNF